MQELLTRKIAGVLGIAAEEVGMSVPELDQFGHFSINAALRLAKTRGSAPQAVAAEFATRLQEELAEVFARVEVVPPGFINLWLTERFLHEQFLHAGPPQQIGQGKVLVIDQCGTNIAKPMHVGHLRSTIIGAALSNIYAFFGYKVVRWNYLGDWGTQFGKLIAAYKLWGDKQAVNEKPIETLLALYVRFHDELKTNPDLEQRGQEEFKKLEEGDAENKKLWEWFRDESLIAFEKTYKRLGVHFDHTIGEAYYEEVLRPTVQELKEKELAVPSEGGLIIHLDQFKLPVALIQKSDGATLYLTRDIASIKHRVSKYKPEKLLYVVANEQTLHFQQLFAIAQLLGITTPTEHVKFGMVLGPDGKKLSTREGRAVKLEEVLDEVVKRAQVVVAKNNAEMSETEQRQIAEVVGIGALKYNDLKENRNSDIVFNWDKMLDFHGDSAPYLQYTVTRLKNIVRKAGTQPEFQPEFLALLQDQLETKLMKKVLDFNDVVLLCATTEYTSHLAKYLFDLAKLANQYYEQVRILDDEQEQRRVGRIQLVTRVAQTVETGLGLLGIQVPERI